MALKLFVGNLPRSVADSALSEFVTNAGFSVASAVVIRDKMSGESKGFGFVEMANNGEAEAAITALNGKDSGGRALTVNEARPKAERSGGFRGGRGGGGRDNDRGHSRQPREPRW